MRENETVTVCLGRGGQRDLAESIAKKVGVPLSERQGDGVSVLIDSSGVQIASGT